MKQIYTLKEQKEIRELFYLIHRDTKNGDEYFLDNVYQFINKKESKQEQALNEEIRAILIKEEILEEYVQFQIYTDSEYIPEHCPKYIKNKFFNWKDASGHVAKYAPEYMDANKFNWENHGVYIPQYCPEHLDTNKYNWEKYSFTVVIYCPEKLDLNKASLKNITEYLSQYKNMTLEEIKQKAILKKL